MQMMNYGNMNRGMGGAPQPQRQGGGRNRNMGGRPNFRGNTRFDHGNGPHQQTNQNRPAQQNARPNNVEVAKPEVQTPTKPAVVTPQTPAKVDTPAPATPVTSTPFPNKSQTQTPAQNQPKPQQNQNQQNASFQKAQGNQNQLNSNFQKPQGNQSTQNATFQKTQTNQNQPSAGFQKPQGNQTPQNTGFQKPQGNQTQQNANFQKPQGNQNQQNANFQKPQGNPNQSNQQTPSQTQNSAAPTFPKPANQNEGNQAKAAQPPQNQKGPAQNQVNKGPQNQNAGQYQNQNHQQSMDTSQNFQRGGNQNRDRNNSFVSNRGGVRNQGGRNPRPSVAGDERKGRDNIPMGAREEHILAMKLKDLQGPLVDLPALEQSEVKFSGRSRLYVGNLSSDITEEEVQEMFSAFGETSELFINKEKNFGFIRMDYKANAERAKRELDGVVRRGRPLRVRFAPHNSAVRIKNLTPFVSNELLHRSFEIFGKIERAYVKVDDRGKSLCEGVVEFARKASAMSAIRNCTDKCYFLTSSLRPVVVESFEDAEEIDGYPEKNLPKKHPDYVRSREMGPRFAEQGSFEHEYGTRWKQLSEQYRTKSEALLREKGMEEEKLEAQMEYAKYEHETELLREQLRQRESDRERQKRSWELAERAADERREANRTAVLMQEEELSDRMRRQEEELRRRQQENTLFMQAQHLNSMLDQQEQVMGTSHSAHALTTGYDDKVQGRAMDSGYGLESGYEMGRGYEDMLGGGQRWDSRGAPRDDFQNKRRRF